MIKEINKIYIRQEDLIKSSTTDGTCIFTSIYSICPQLFNNNKEMINNLIKKTNERNISKYADVLKLINQDIKNRLNIDEAIRHQYYNNTKISSNIIFLNILNNLAKDKPLVLSIFLPEELENSGHVVEVFGLDTQKKSIKIFENGNDREFIVYVAKKLLKDSNNSQEYLEENIPKIILNRQDRFVEVNLDELFKVINEAVLIWVDTSNSKLNNLIKFSERLDDIILNQKIMDKKISIPESVRKIIDKLYGK